MGFQLPPTLPDYSKLNQVLNSSGMQKVNPPVYEILSRLIQAVQQSQDTFISNVITNTVNNNITNGNIIIPSSGGSPEILVSDKTITGAQAKTLFTTPIDIVGNPTGGILLPLKAIFHCSQPATYFFTRNADLAYDVIGGSPVGISILGPITQIQTNATQDVWKIFEPNNIGGSTLGNPFGKDIWLQATADNNVGGFDPGNINQILIRVFSLMTVNI
jgi:hypothetical protein